MSEYKSRRNSNNINQDYNSSSLSNDKKAQEQESAKKAAKVAAKGAATYFGGAAGGAAVDALSKTKAGDALLNKGADKLGKIPGVKKAAKKLDDNGALDKADKAISVAGGAAGGAAEGAKSKPNVSTTDRNSVTEGKDANKDAGGNTSKNGDPSSSSSNNKDNNSSLNRMEKGLGSNNNSDSSLIDHDENDIPHVNTSNVLKGFLKLPMPVKIAILSIIPIAFFAILIFTVISSVTGVHSSFDDAYGMGTYAGKTSEEFDFKVTGEAKEFFDRVDKVNSKYSERGIVIDPMLVMSTFHIIHTYNDKIDYDDMNNAAITEIIDSMLRYDEENDDYYYDETVFRTNLTDKIFVKYLYNLKEEDRIACTDEVFTYLEDYYEYIGYNNELVCGDVDSCSYEVNTGFYVYGKGNISKNTTYNNLKVRLMQSGGIYGGVNGQPLEGEELVPFEKYVLGVAYAEIGDGAPDEAFKAQLVAARSYALTRPSSVGGWRTLKQEGDSWILQLAASTQDQVYCDPDQGCSSTSGQNGMVHSGLSFDRGYRKQPLPENSRLRTLAAEVAGEVLTNSEGYIINTSYTNVQQNQFSALARQGMNYKQILLQVYNSGSKQYGASNINKYTCAMKNECLSAAGEQVVTGEYSTWKQKGAPWSSIRMGTSSKNVGQIGCLVTSIAMQIARSGVPTNIQGEFNPGSFVEYLNSHGGFSGGDLMWASVSKAAPSFRYIGRQNVLGYSKQQKLSTLSSLINSGYYVVTEVKGNTGQHWVAVVGTNGEDVVMMDPGSSSTSMWSQYNWVNTSAFVYFKAG